MTKQEMHEAKAELRADGWEFILSAMHSGDKSNGEFGSLFTKDGEQFWLNIQTFNNLPVEN